MCEADAKVCKYCHNDAEVSIDDDGFYFVGCVKDYKCKNNIFKSNKAFETEHDAVVWWNDNN